MILYPSIDVRGGQVVRLREGDPNRETVFSADPLATARRWIDAGAKWLHMVNLDGAFNIANDTLGILAAVATLSVRVQFGGGLRSTADVARAFDAGAARVVLGTVALEKPEIVAESVERWGPEAICVALDARGGKVTTHGWQQTSDQTPAALGRAMTTYGVRHALYTDVLRDGGLMGVNVLATAALARTTGLSVIASGGLSSLDDVRALRDTGIVAGAVLGTALYRNAFTLEEALQAVHTA
jgi:phosphoribosylformimino-5-aminoimidazole carboxamide ribotide isomerase